MEILDIEIERDILERKLKKLSSKFERINKTLVEQETEEENKLDEQLQSLLHEIQKTNNEIQMNQLESQYFNNTQTKEDEIARLKLIINAYEIDFKFATTPTQKIELRHQIELKENLLLQEQKQSGICSYLCSKSTR
jgi:hypothetical protein